MNIVIRKLVFNESDIHVLLWKDRPCFLVSELSKALDSVNKEDIPVFLRSGGTAVKGMDFDVVAGADARDLRSYLEHSGIKKRFAHTMLIYFDGLRKYFNFRKTIESKDFISYLEKSKISLESESVSPVGKLETQESTVVSVPEDKPATLNKPIAAAIPAPEPKPASKEKTKVAAASVERKTTTSKREPEAKASTTTTEYSELIKHISFMEEFVDAFNKIKITPDKSAAFTKSMAKFLEDNGMQANKLLQEIKKWIV